MLCLFEKHSQNNSRIRLFTNSVTMISKCDCNFLNCVWRKFNPRFKNLFCATQRRRIRWDVFGNLYSICNVVNIFAYIARFVKNRFLVCSKLIKICIPLTSDYQEDGGGGVRVGYGLSYIMFIVTTITTL